MDILIVNELEYPVHVTVVEHSVLALEFVLSETRVPIPFGTPVRREVLDPGQVLAVQGLPDGTNATLRKRRLPTDIRVKKSWGTASDKKDKKKSFKFIEIILMPIGGDGSTT
jgi:hypothetical protein